MKKDRAIVFTLSSNLTFSVACVMLNLKAISPNIADEIVILHDGISSKDQRLLSSILPTRFILYNFPIKDESIFNQDTIACFTKMVFAKFECLKLLDEYSNVLLTDSDVVIQQDISELFAWCESGIKMMPSGAKVRGQLHSGITDYNMNVEAIAAAVFVFQDHLKDYNKMYDFCYEALAKYADSLRLPEQAIFDFMIQEFKLKIEPIDRKVYSPHPNNAELASNAMIIHAFGQPKFWNGLQNESWNKNYKSWVSMGGSKYNKTPLINKVFKKIKRFFT